jgi:hypothetical protein
MIMIKMVIVGIVLPTITTIPFGMVHVGPGIILLGVVMLIDLIGIVQVVIIMLMEPFI